MKVLIDRSFEKDTDKLTDQNFFISLLIVLKESRMRISFLTFLTARS